MSNTSIFYTIPENILKDIVLNSNSYNEVFRKLNLCISGYQCKKLKQRLIELNINTSHFKSFDKNQLLIKRPIDYYLTNNLFTKITSYDLKKKLLLHNLIKNECKICKNTGIWENKTLSLQLDHINGIRTDNRLENLRLLCPNCHSQTDTYSGKKHKKDSFCKECGNIKKDKSSNLCKRCFYISQEKIIWPSDEELLKLVWEQPLYKLSKLLKVSDNAIKKRLIKRNINFPKQGYWLRK